MHAMEPEHGQASQRHAAAACLVSDDGALLLAPAPRPRLAGVPLVRPAGGLEAHSWEGNAVRAGMREAEAWHVNGTSVLAH